MGDATLGFKKRFGVIFTILLHVCIICSSIFLVPESAFSQSKVSLGFAAGYGTVSMSEVNSDLKDSYQTLTSAGIPASSPNDVSGGLFIDGSILYRPSRLFFGGSVNYISSSGDITYSDASGSFEEKYDTKSIEILANFGSSLPVDSTVSLFIKLAGGYGSASSTHIGRVNFYSSPQNNINVNNDVSGGYFAGRVQGGIEILVQQVRLNASLGYRIANAGALKGPMTYNGQSQGDQTVKNARGGDINFDFSGVTFTAGISFEL